jgi:hypothetical protein
MPRKQKYRMVVSLLIASLFFPGLSNAGEGRAENAKLLEQQKQLSRRIETLRQEQDYLLFQKEMYESDSKYLILNLSTKTGQMKYKNRVLKDFSFKIVSRRRSAVETGAVRLTKKVDASKAKKVLIFGKSLVLEERHASANRPGATATHLLLSKRDLPSIFYAVETGAAAYILR